MGMNRPAKIIKQYLTKFVEYWKAKDNRHLYTTAAGWPVVSESDYNSTPDPTHTGMGRRIKKHH